MRQEIGEAIGTIDNLIRRGRGGEARARLRALTQRKVPRDHSAAVASLLRRAGLPSLAIRLLNPIVRPNGRNAAEATDEEKAEYAAALSFIGAANEALHLLRSFDAKTVPQRFLYEAYALMSQWNYEATIPLLSQYVKSRGITSYQRLVGKVNLAAALVHERQFNKASYLLKDVAYETSTRKLSLLHGLALELSAQNCIFQSHWEGAERFLRQSESLLQNTEGIEAFLVRKWKAILEMRRTHGDKQARALLQAVKKEAIGFQHWETVRDCDRFEATIRADSALFVHAYFGTPFPSFRKWMLADCEREIALPEEYIWYPGPGKQAGTVIDLLTAEYGEGRSRLKAGQLVHRLLVGLSSDFYRPFRLASLYGMLYPSEFFNPVTSPMRIHQATRHLRHWLKTSSIPIELVEKTGLYRLSGAGGLRIPRSQAIGEKLSGFLHRLKAQWGSQPFSIGDVLEHLEMPRRSALRALQGAFKSGALLRAGKGAGTRYCFPKD